MAKRITFDPEIIETLHTRLRQFTTIVWWSAKEWYTRTRMDDVDYLVEDNAMDDFCLSPEMEETHGGMAHWRCKLGTKCNAGNDSSNWGRTQQ